MKKKSGHHRRTKVVRKSRKNLRRTIKRKSVGKGRRRPTRRYSRVQRGGLTKGQLDDLIKKANVGDKIAQHSQFKLGVMFDRGEEGVAQNYAEAFKWFKLAAENRNADAQFKLGMMYEEGRGVAQDYAEAVQWYQHAAAQGHATAQYKLGVMYEEGRGVDQNYDKALLFYRPAAAQGNADAWYKLGMMYEHGRGVRQNYEYAHNFYNYAATQGHEGASAKLNELKK